MKKCNADAVVLGRHNKYYYYWFEGKIDKRLEKF